MLGHVTYLSADGIERKFGRRRQPPPAQSSSAAALPRPAVAGERGPYAVEFAVESYLNYQGLSFVERFDANSYLAITKAADRFDLAGERPLEAVFANTTARVTLIGFTSDWLYPPAENKPVLDALRRAGKRADYIEIETDGGHDAFLLPNPALFAALRTGLTTKDTARFFS
jgi:homoserine O-acetyltransferase